MRKWKFRLLLMIIGIIAIVDVFFIAAIIRNRYYLFGNDYIEEIVESEVTGITQNGDGNSKTSEIDQDTSKEGDFEGQITSENIEQDSSGTTDNTESENSDSLYVKNAPVKWINERKYFCEENMDGMSSYDATMEINKRDKEIIAASKIDFTGMVLTAYGDSLTEGIGLSPHDQPKYNWEAQTMEILGYEDFYNLGRSGSTIYGKGEYYPMTERWEEIREESDIIVVMGGTNDIITGTAENFGEIYAEERARDTFCGDLDYLLSSIREKYCTEDHYCRLIYINPPGCPVEGTEDEIRRGLKVRQEKYAEAINVIAAENGYDVIDFYHSNFMDPRDPRIEEELSFDGIHYNQAGYRIIAEHVSSILIQLICQEE